MTKLELIKRVERLEKAVGLSLEKNELLCRCGVIHKIEDNCTGFTCRCGQEWSRDRGWCENYHPITNFRCPCYIQY